MYGWQIHLARQAFNQLSSKVFCNFTITVSGECWLLAPPGSLHYKSMVTVYLTAFEVDAERVLCAVKPLSTSCWSNGRSDSWVWSEKTWMMSEGSVSTTWDLIVLHCLGSCEPRSGPCWLSMPDSSQCLVVCSRLCPCLSLEMRPLAGL